MPHIISSFEELSYIIEDDLNQSFILDENQWNQHEDIINSLNYNKMLEIQKKENELKRKREENERFLKEVRIY